jgi:hypothetical protein
MSATAASSPPARLSCATSPPGCVVVGNPARVVEKDLRTGKFGVRLDAAAAESPEPQPPAPDKRDDEARDKISALS